MDQEEVFLVLEGEAAGRTARERRRSYRPSPALEDRDVACPDCECDHMRISRTDGVDFECPQCVDFECPECDATLVLEDE